MLDPPGLPTAGRIFLDLEARTYGPAKFDRGKLEVGSPVPGHVIDRVGREFVPTDHSIVQTGSSIRSFHRRDGTLIWPVPPSFRNMTTARSPSGGMQADTETVCQVSR
jgi:hypothetical protein